MRKINLLCVEDGSVDLDNLLESGLQDEKILVYRQGARPPFVLSIEIDENNADLQETIKSFINFLQWGKENIKNFKQRDIVACINQKISQLRRQLNGKEAGRDDHPYAG